MNIKKIGFLLILFFWCLPSQAQEIYNSSGKKGDAKYAPNKQKEGFDPQRLIVGGGFTLSGGSGIFLAGASPIIGYRITNRLSAGVRLGYLYQFYKDGQSVMDGITGQILYKNLNYSILSGGAWTRFLVFENFFAQAEFEHNIFTYKEYFTTNQGVAKRRISDNANSLLLGGGLRQPITDRMSFVIVASYDVLQNIPSNQRTDIYGRTYSRSPYANTIDIKVGINIGF